MNRNIIKKIRRHFQKRGGITAVYLYGSRALNTNSPASDIDIALLVKKHRAKKPFELGIKYRYELGKLLECEVDIVILNNADPFLRFQVYKKGKPIIIRSKKEAEDFKWRSIREYWDYIPLKRKMEDEAIHRMKNY